MPFKVEHSKPLRVEEPAFAYGMTSLFELSSRSVTKDYLKRLLKSSGLSVTELIDLLPISIDTYKRKSVFDRGVTEKVLEIEEVYKEGISLFGNSFHEWMDAPNPSFDGRRPKELLQNSFGVRMLLDQLGRMAHGVYA